MFSLVHVPAIILGLTAVWTLLPQWFKSGTIAIIRMIHLLIVIKSHSLMNSRTPKFSFADMFESIVSANPNRVQFISIEDDREVTLRELDNVANQVAWWLIKEGVKAKDSITIMMLNRPEFVAIWLGCCKAAATTAFINTNTTGKPLLHAVDVALTDSTTKIMIVDGDLKSFLTAEDLSSLKSAGVRVFFWDELSSTTGLVGSQDIARPPKSTRASVLEKDPLMLIYTSGTTGMPKASKISHSRFLAGSQPFSILCALTSRDRIYNVLPLYHSAAGIFGVGAALKSGACMVLKRKFSVKSFSADCRKYKCTAVQYIGELCRFLCNSPESADDGKLQLRNAWGNGMRPDVWTKFQKRFGVEHVVEFYGSTEGNLALFNGCDKVGSLGFVPRIVDFLYPVRIVRTDALDKSIPFRDASGRCVICKPDEVGLLVGVINNKRIDRRFEGYTDKTATSKKILSDVLVKGDSYFNSGDLVTRDYWGFFYWSDRTGDTFRWKGENVATTEVTLVVADCPNVTDATVYGVDVPNCDGKAGMAAITLMEGLTADTFDWAALQQQCQGLPPYARPLFIRVQSAMMITSTFKHVKGDLVKEGFDPSVVKDPVYFLSVRDKKFVPLTPELYSNIIGGKIQL